MTGFSWDQVQIFRCQGCGKWSHAKKQPKKHQRWVYEGDPDFDDSLVDNVGSYDHMNGFVEGPYAHPVACGPFTPWVATPGRLT